MPSIKMICLDLDGTLLQKDGSVSEEDKRSLQWCIVQGIQVYLVSGRPYFFTKHIANQIDPNVKVICSNGGYYEKGKQVVKYCITSSALTLIMDTLKAYECHAFYKNETYIYTKDDYDERFVYDHMYTQYNNFPYTKSYSSLSDTELMEQAKEVIKILVYNFNKEQLAQARSALEKLDTIVVSSYNDISIDINAKDVDKGKAIQDVCAYHGIDLSEVMAIGDGENDLPMFAVAGVSIAMENANAHIKDICSDTTTSYEENGVSKAILKYCK